jgi:hypothetical protein
MLVGTSTAYFRVASEAASELLHLGILKDAVQYHVVDGGTRITPLEHGRVLLGLLTGRAYDSPSIQRRWLGQIVAGGAGLRKRIESTGSLHVAVSDAANATAALKSSGPMMRRAPPPNASREEIARLAVAAIALNELVHQAESPPAAIDIQRADLPSTAAINQPASANPTVGSVVIASECAEHCARFNDLLRRLLSGAYQGLSLSTLIEVGRLPDRGVYFFMDAPDPSDASTWRVCRIGTHAVSTGSKSTLRARLKTHLGSRNGNGNHRGSIFRLHVGNALLRRAGIELSTWGVGSVAPPALRESESLRLEEELHERHVSQYVGSLHVLWVDVPDEPSPESARSTIERNAIALLSRQARLESIVPKNWLGQDSHRIEIRSSFLWNINYVNDNYDSGFLDVLEQAVERTLTQFPEVSAIS